MENLLQGLKHICVYIEDVLVTGTTEAEHIANVEEVLKRLQAARMRSKKEKCMLAPEVKYLGHHISNQGIEPTEGQSCYESSSSSEYFRIKGFYWIS